MYRSISWRSVVLNWMQRSLRDTIARQIENRINYKRAIKMAIASALRMGAEGIKVKVGGRLGGAEIARTEEIKQGRTPLHTFRMDIDYANVFALDCLW